MEELNANEYLRGIVLNLPTGPGIYQYLNKEGTIIYVGKAKNLKRRVYSYFSKEHQSAKTRILVSKIADIRYIVVNTEEDALLLENNLIKKYKPRYNVLLKDDKSYPSICVTNEYFPRVFKTRKIVRNGSTYYGPYSHVPSMMAVLELIKKLYPAAHVQSCSYSGKHPKRQVQRLLGVSYQELQGSVYRHAIARGIYAEHRPNKGDSEGEYSNHQRGINERNDEFGSRHEVRRGAKGEREIRAYRNLPFKERSGEFGTS